jgi:hypothetical protein
MGLDMYLYVEKYVSAKDYDRSEGGDLNVTDNQTFTNLATILDATHLLDPDSWTGMTVRIPVGYWRKANSIHNYIVENFADGEDNCQDIGLSRDNLTTLRDYCALAVSEYESNNSTKVAEELLPTRAGFFFGGLEYDEWYFQDLQNTIAMIDRVLSNSENDWFIYRASW